MPKQDHKDHPDCTCNPSEYDDDDCPIHGMLPVPESKDST